MVDICFFGTKMSTYVNWWEYLTNNLGKLLEAEWWTTRVKKSQRLLF
jgi:hypothetical protein